MQSADPYIVSLCARFPTRFWTEKKTNDARVKGDKAKRRATNLPIHTDSELFTLSA